MAIRMAAEQRRIRQREECAGLDRFHGWKGGFGLAEGVGVLKGFERSAFRLLPCSLLVGGIVVMSVEEEEK